jgi:hypothetical protein
LTANIIWDELSKMDITDVAQRSSAVLSGDNLYLSIIGEPVEISCRDKTITKSEDKSSVSREESFVTLKYLLGVKDLPLAGKWVNPLEFIGGDLYFRSHKFNLWKKNLPATPKAFWRREKNWVAHRKRWETPHLP